jgi:hypothetical protein
VACHPFQLWRFNHIIGYIVISTDFNAVYFDLYKQADGQYNKSRYSWRSTQKWFFEDQGLGGWHFRLDSKYSNEDIRMKINSWLENLITAHLPKKYYVDKEAFCNINGFMDYKSLISCSIHDEYTHLGGMDKCALEEAYICDD